MCNVCNIQFLSNVCSKPGNSSHNVSNAQHLYLPKRYSDKILMSDSNLAWDQSYRLFAKVLVVLILIPILFVLNPTSSEWQQGCTHMGV